MSSRAFTEFKRHWYEPAVLPLWAIIGGAVGLAGWYTYRLATRPDVVWDHKNNPEPWQKIEQGTQVKLHAVHQKYDDGKKYKRDQW